MNEYISTPDHPTVRALCRTGNPDGRFDPPVPRCPVCGHETDLFYTLLGVPVGCSRCIRRVDAYTEECYE